MNLASFGTWASHHHRAQTAGLLWTLLSCANFGASTQHCTSVVERLAPAYLINGQRARNQQGKAIADHAADSIGFDNSMRRMRTWMWSEFESWYRWRARFRCLGKVNISE